MCIHAAAVTDDGILLFGTTISSVKVEMCFISETLPW